MSNCTICVAKTKALISCTVNARLICVFVVANANCWISNALAHIVKLTGKQRIVINIRCFRTRLLYDHASKSMSVLILD